jgi:hypothetical protein
VSGGELEGGGENQIAVEFPSVSFTSGTSSREDAHAESSSSREVTIWTDLEGEYKELKGIKCNSSQQVEAVLLTLQAQHECFPSTSRGRGILASECYGRATSSEGDNRVYVTMDVEL